MEDKLKAMDLGGAAFAVTVADVTPAEAGDAKNEQGSAGSYAFTVTLTLDKASAAASGSGVIST